MLLLLVDERMNSHAHTAQTRNVSPSRAVLVYTGQLAVSPPLQSSGAAILARS